MRLIGLAVVLALSFVLALAQGSEDHAAAYRSAVGRGSEEGACRERPVPGSPAGGEATLSNDNRLD